METRVLTPKEYAQARRVWEICFPDDEKEFVAYYFQKRTRPEWVLGAFDGERLIGTVHMLPQTAHFCGVEKRVGFVAGVAALPEERGKGVAGKLMRDAFDVMRECGFSVTILKPFSLELERYYTRFGYAPFVYRDEYKLTAADFSSVPEAETHRPDAAELLRIYRAFSSGLSGMRVRGEGEFALLLEELETYPSDIVSDGGAYAMCYLGEDTARVFELAGEDAAPLLKVLCKKYGRVEAALPVGRHLLTGKTFERNSFDMIKLLDERAFLSGLPMRLEELLAQKDASFSFESY